MIPEAAVKIIRLRECYKIAFGTPEGKTILNDLVKRYVLSDPVVIDDPQATAVNLGMQRLAVQILKKVYGSAQDIRNLIERSYEQTNTE